MHSPTVWITHPAKDSQPSQMPITVGSRIAVNPPADVLKIGTEAVSWSSKLQGIVALSSTEAKYSTAIEARK